MKYDLSNKVVARLNEAESTLPNRSLDLGNISTPELGLLSPNRNEIAPRGSGREAALFAYSERLRNSYKQNDGGLRDGMVLLGDAFRNGQPISITCFCRAGQMCHADVVKLAIEKVAKAIEVKELNRVSRHTLNQDSNFHPSNPRTERAINEILSVSRADLELSKLDDTDGRNRSEHASYLNSRSQFLRDTYERGGTVQNGVLIIPKESHDLKSPLQLATLNYGVIRLEPLDILAKLSQYFLLLGDPNLQLSPRWLADRLETTERDLLDTLAYALRDGIAELHWEVFCTSCGGAAETFASLTHAKSQIDCLGCESKFELHLDRNVNVTFSASERLRRERGGERILMPSNSLEFAPTKGLDLLLIPSFHKLFSGETPSVNESLRISYVTILFTDLRGSTAMYAERGDPQAYKMVREHFDILTDAIERNRGVFIKTIGDSVMASFATGADAINAVFESQTELRARTAEMGGELILKAGIHAGPCLAVNLNDSLDYFGTVVNTAARLEGLSLGNDVVVSDVVFEDAKKEISHFCTVEDIDAKLRGLADTFHIRRLSEC